jgi:diguanylate cyclase (GGDEF)-like protein/PAS domain S-box-containing protein
MLDRLKIRAKLALLLGLSGISLSSVLVLGGFFLHGKVLSDREEQVKKLVQVATGIVEIWHAKEVSGSMTRQQAQAGAIETLRPLHYGQGDYFFVHSYDGVALFNPVLPKVEGQWRWNAVDADGLHHIQLQINTARRGGGFVYYRFPRVGGTEPLQKLSYVSGFDPWQWVLGTGVYVDDITREFWSAMVRLGALSFGIFAMAAGSAFLINRDIGLPLRRLHGEMERLAHGDLDVDVADSARRDELGDMGKAVKVFRDNAQEMRRLQAKQDDSERLRQLTESTFEALLIHRGGETLDANSAFCELIGRPLSAIKGLPIETFLPEGDRISPISPVTGKPEAFETQIAAVAGEALPVEVLSREVQFAGGVARVTALRDIRERRAAEARIRFLAQHDALTGLPNRSQFHEVINRELALSKRDGIPLAVMCIDLDRFKNINDTLGHWAGDLVLKQVAERLLGVVRESDIVARIGGDEFVLLQTAVSQPEASGALAARIIETLSKPFDLNGNQMTIGASVGIALSPQDSTLADVLVQNADIALYRAKSERGTFCFFQAGMDTLIRERRELEQDIIRATASGEFHLDFQPLFSGARLDKSVGFEALIRWNHPRLGLIFPDQFIPLAEETGLIVPLGAWVLEAACREAASWPSQYRVSVNVSPRQFTGGDFPSLVADVLRRTGLPAERLEIEITEALLFKDGEAALGMLLRLKQSGVRIALDDFGTGYSSLSYLQRFPFDRVKIDQSFVGTLTTSEDARAIVSAILAMSHQLRLEVTAEGVETNEQLAFLRAQHCDQIQGFLLSHPLSREQLHDYILRALADPPTNESKLGLTAA